MEQPKLKCKHCESDITETIRLKSGSEYREIVHRKRCPLIKELKRRVNKK